jgi:hypothetical protein
MSENRVKAVWTGRYPTLCFGEWKLYLNRKDISKKIPKDLRECPMYTYGTYQRWHFVDWIEEFEDYEDGLKCDEWVKENKSWLKKISDDEELWRETYKAFQAEDWRVGECGGCI